MPKKAPAKSSKHEKKKEEMNVGGEEEKEVFSKEKEIEKLRTSGSMTQVSSPVLIHVISIHANVIALLLI